MSNLNEYYFPVQGEAATIIPKKHWDDLDSVDLASGKGGIGVYNIAAGEVVESRNYVPNNYGYPNTGNCVGIKITEECGLKDYYVSYFHLMQNDNQYKVGAYVPKGTEIGKVGNTGYSTGDHLHIQIRSNSCWEGYVPAINNADYEYRGGFGFSDCSGITDQLFRCLAVPLKENAEVGPVPDSTTQDVRIACTIALFEAQILGMIGMEEVIAIVYNRMKSSSFPNSAYGVVSAHNQFTPYTEHKALFDSGGYTIEQIESKAPGLVAFAEGLIEKGTIRTDSSVGWANGYNPKIALAYFFRSDILINKDYLYTRAANGTQHYYNGIHMWS